MLKNYYDFDALWNDDLTFNEIISYKNNVYTIVQELVVSKNLHVSEASIVLLGN